ncbi:uncharacterized protein LOC128873176 [Hylaeus volcanicus]|uniref:uncharacterized protein LOC128873176 n=1 Tax=Hylaeus volcanicus TaxID=313075 RepID=UPI0023B794FE|nr:uncharacterized protein LOC128873176 [Hylaeus volcanicus]
MTKIIRTAFAALCLVALANGQGSLLEMSQQLWMKLLTGGFSKTGKLDPLKVPVIKVDQSEDDTSYRIILRNVEISGLNASTVESIHIAKGRLKSNLSELEAGYVSYSDLRDLDSIRYRFHMLVKEPKGQNESFEAIVSATNQENKFQASSPDQESRFERLRQYDPFLMKIQAEKMKDRTDGSRSEQNKSEDSSYGGFSMEGARVVSRPETARIRDNSRYPSDVQPVYGTKESPNSRNYQSRENYESSSRSNQRNYQPPYDSNSGSNSRSNQQKNYESNSRNYQSRYDSNSESSSRNYQQEDYDRARTDAVLKEYERSRNENERENVGNQRKVNFGRQRAEERYGDVETAASENVESSVKGQDQGIIPGYGARGQQGRLEKQSGYIDIVYADGNDNGNIKRFGNEKIESRGDAKVYGVKDVPKDFLDKRRMLSYNCTEGEALTKRNDAVKAAIEAKTLKGLSRYAKEYQEKEGYFEEGMQLVYHYGGMESKNAQGSRRKRAHQENHTDDDVMHVIIKIRVPLLRIKSDYQLTGKVGKELVRGTGKLNGTFTELVGDFTVELKKNNGEDTLIVRAARSKLKAKQQNVDLQGMDEKGPVKSILSHGLMAAEAVAAMLADDLATKALNDKTADAMIYRMYKNLPVN